MKTTIVFAAVSAAVHSVSAGSSIPGSDIQSTSGNVLLGTAPYGSKLYKIDAQESTYDDAPYLLDLTSETFYQQGYDNAYLMGAKYIENYDFLMTALLGDEWWEPAVAELINAFLDWQWNDYLSVQLPNEYIEEFHGMTDGGRAANLDTDIAVIAGRGITLANLPGTLSNIKYLLQDEKENPAHGRKSSEPLSDEQVAVVVKKLGANWLGLTCSMFGVWGSRTANGALYTGRNLDWLKDAGISKNKLITIHHPPNAYSHATFGWAGIWGAITGISSQGITVHEANLESDDITWRGFPWVLRLRHVMAHAKNIEEGLSIWAATNNTVGFNHGIGSASDGEAVCMETMHGNTAVFHANDPREQDSRATDGEARPEAVYRTNHGYDSYTKEHYIDDESTYNNSLTRYLLFPEMFDNYETQKTPISYVEAVNITAVVGNKGMDSIYECSSNSGSNVLSVTYDPASLLAYAAWENGSEEEWRPAACNTYLALDMQQWLSPSSSLSSSSSYSYSSSSSSSSSSPEQ